MHLTCTNQVKEKCDFGLTGREEGGHLQHRRPARRPAKGPGEVGGDRGRLRVRARPGEARAPATAIISRSRSRATPRATPTTSSPCRPRPRALRDGEDARRLRRGRGARLLGRGHGDRARLPEAEGATRAADERATPIITQLFYDIAVFEDFVATAAPKGITAPIFPGIMPLNAYGGFKRMTGFCKTRIPPEMAERMELKGDDKKKAFHRLRRRRTSPSSARSSSSRSSSPASTSIASTRPSARSRSSRTWATSRSRPRRSRGARVRHHSCVHVLPNTNNYKAESYENAPPRYMSVTIGSIASGPLVPAVIPTARIPRAPTSPTPPCPSSPSARSWRRCRCRRTWRSGCPPPTATAAAATAAAAGTAAAARRRRERRRRGGGLGGDGGGDGNFIHSRNLGSQNCFWWRSWVWRSAPLRSPAASVLRQAAGSRGARPADRPGDGADGSAAPGDTIRTQSTRRCASSTTARTAGRARTAPSRATARRSQPCTAGPTKVAAIRVVLAARAGRLRGVAQQARRRGGPVALARRARVLARPPQPAVPPRTLEGSARRGAVARADGAVAAGRVVAPRPGVDVAVGEEHRAHPVAPVARPRALVQRGAVGVQHRPAPWRSPASAAGSGWPPPPPPKRRGAARASTIRPPRTARSTTSSAGAPPPRASAAAAAAPHRAVDRVPPEAQRFVPRPAHARRDVRAVVPVEARARRVGERGICAHVAAATAKIAVQRSRQRMPFRVDHSGTQSRGPPAGVAGEIIDF